MLRCMSDLIFIIVMKFKQIILAVFSASALFIGTEAVLQKTQDEAFKFLVDEGHITAEAVVESFMVDRTGNIRLRVTQGDQIYSYGLQEAEDTYEISFMSKKKAPKTANKQQETDQITKLLEQNLDILKGGKVNSVTQETGRRKRGSVIISYTHNSKEYQIKAYHDMRKGELSIKSVKEVAASEL